MWLRQTDLLTLLSFLLLLDNLESSTPEPLDKFLHNKNISANFKINARHLAAHPKCIRVEDVRLTFQEWSDVILVSLFSSSPLASPLTTQSTAFSESSDEKNNLKRSHQLNNHPQQLHGNPQQVLLKFVVNKTSYDLTLKLQKEPYKEPLKTILNSIKTVSNSIPKRCYYFGNMWKNKRTLAISAFIGICDRTSGVIFLGRETFIIRPLEFDICEDNNEISQTHIAFKISSESDEDKGPDPICGINLWNWKKFSISYPHKAEYLRNLKIGKSTNSSKLSHCLVIKLGLILDHSLMIVMNASVEDIQSQMLILSNILNQNLKELHKNIRLELVHLDLWNDGDNFSTSSGIRWTLTSLVNFAKRLVETQGSNFHYLHLLSGNKVNGPYYGASVPDSICSDRAVGVSHVENPHDLVSMAAEIVHMLGHVMGLGHDGLHADNDMCPDLKGHAMTPKKTSIMSHSRGSSHVFQSPFVELHGNKGKSKRTNHLHSDFNHRNRYHQFQLGWSNCSLHEFLQNLKSKFLDCLKVPCTFHRHRGETVYSQGTTTELNGDANDEIISHAIDESEDIIPPYLESEKNFPSKCGNGVLERGEECDCGTEQDCLASDPCCDFRTCLIKPWTSCTKGDCCFNCSLLPSTHVCRKMNNSCDVPEFCTGTSEKCPEDSLVLDGQSCIQMNLEESVNDTQVSSEPSLCYKGSCKSYDSQCSLLWGRESTKASDRCFSTFNQIGAVSGHCGSLLISSSSSPLPTSLHLLASTISPPSNTTSESSTASSIQTDYVKCSQRDVKCGLLHCKGGSRKPLVENRMGDFFETTITSHGRSYQCKVMSNPTNPFLYLVEDGSPCSKDSICISNKCVPIADVISSEFCPRGKNNLICSGNGVCTNRMDCFCRDQYSGWDCSSIVNKTTPLTLFSIFTEVEITEEYLNNTSNTTEEVEAVEKRNSVNNVRLLGAMSFVVIGASAILILCLVCYRRKTPKLTKKQQICQLRNQSLMSIQSHESNLRANRIISFGSLPSYRADKLRKAMRGSNQSETESEKSSKRNSAELNIRMGREVKVTYLPLPDPPDKGILKRPENKCQKRNRLGDGTAAGSDVGSLPSDSMASDDQRRGKVSQKDKVRSRVNANSENFSVANEHSKGDVKSVIIRSSTAMMPDVLPKVSEHTTTEANPLSANSSIGGSNVGSKSLAGKLADELKSEPQIEAPTIEDTGTMSSFLSSSDIEASPLPGAPAPSLCSENSPQPLQNLHLGVHPSPVSPDERSKDLKLFTKGRTSFPSSNSPNFISLSATTASYSSDVIDGKNAMLMSSVPLRKSLERSSGISFAATKDFQTRAASDICHETSAPSSQKDEFISRNLSNFHSAQETQTLMKRESCPKSHQSICCSSVEFEKPAMSTKSRNVVVYNEASGSQGSKRNSEA